MGSMRKNLNSPVGSFKTLVAYYSFFLTVEEDIPVFEGVTKFDSTGVSIELEFNHSRAQDESYKTSVCPYVYLKNYTNIRPIA